MGLPAPEDIEGRPTALLAAGHPYPEHRHVEANVVAGRYERVAMADGSPALIGV